MTTKRKQAQDSAQDRKNLLSKAKKYIHAAEGETIYWSDSPPYRGRWVARVRAKDRFERALPEKRKASLDIQVCLDWLVEQRRDPNRKLPAESKMTVEQWFAQFKESLYWKGLTGATQGNKSNRFTKHIKPVLGHIALQDVSPLLVQRWIQEMIEAKVGASTVVEVRNDLNQLLARAVKLRLLEHNAAQYSELPTLKARFKVTLTAEEARTALSTAVSSMHVGEDTCPKNKIPGWIVGMVAVGVMAGLRRGEIQALTHEQIDVENMTITVDRAVQREASGRQFIGAPKADKFRVVTLIPELLEFIGKTSLSTSGLIWPADPCEVGRFRGESIEERKLRASEPTPKSATRVLIEFDRFKTKCGLPKDMVFRDLRSTYATLLNDLALGAKTVTGMMGHASIKTTTKHYQEVSHAALSDARTKISQLFQEKTPEAGTVGETIPDSK